MSFSADLKKFQVGSIKAAEDTRKAITIELFSSVISDTPVDDGRLRGNWQTSPTTPKTQAIDREDKNGAQATSEAQQATLKSKGDGVLFMTNNLPYAERIEFDGWSKIKAPQGMVRKNVARLAEIISKAAKENKL